MLGLGLELTQPQVSAQKAYALPPGFGWNTSAYPLAITRSGSVYHSGMVPRDLVVPAIWSGPAFHVDGEAGNDGNTGLGASDGDFANAKRTIHAAFTEGNATGAAYRVLVKPGDYSGSAFTKNGKVEPDQPVAIIGWGGVARYRAGAMSKTWTDTGAGTWTTTESSVKRVFRTDVLTANGVYVELTEAPDLATCQTTQGSFFRDGSTVHVNIGGAVGDTDIALIRGFHGARFLNHSADLYLENLAIEGGITGSLHCEATASRNIVGVNCRFCYSAPSNAASPQDAVRIRRTTGLAAFFGCDASAGAKDGWNFHEDGAALHVLLEGCTGAENGWGAATSCNAFTTHDGVRAVVLGGTFGWSRNGAEAHCIQSTETWGLGMKAVARDPDGSSTAYKVSNTAKFWLEETQADAVGAISSYAIEANGGAAYTRGHQTIAGLLMPSSGGTITAF